MHHATMHHITMHHISQATTQPFTCCSGTFYRTIVNCLNVTITAEPRVCECFVQIFWHDPSAESEDVMGSEDGEEGRAQSSKSTGTETQGWKESQARGNVLSGKPTMPGLPIFPDWRMHSPMFWHFKGYFHPLQNILKDIDFENLLFLQNHSEIGNHNNICQHSVHSFRYNLYKVHKFIVTDRTSLKKVTLPKYDYYCISVTK